MSEDNSPKEGHRNGFSEIDTDDKDFVIGENLDTMARKTTKLTVLSNDETFYPIVKIDFPKKQVVLPEDNSIILPGKNETSEKNVVLKKNELPEEEVQFKPKEVKTTVDLMSVSDGTNEVVKERQPVLADTISKIEEPKKRYRILGRVWSGFGSVIVTAIAIIAIVLVGMRLAGFRTFTVMSGSMEPNYPVGALIYVQPVNYKELKVGDVISYVANDDKTVVTHRIAEIERDKDDADVLRFRTKGDANSSADAKLVHYKNVLGTPVIVIPNIGYFAHNIQQPPGVYIALVAGTLLLAWAFLPGTLEERRKTASRSVIIE